MEKERFCKYGKMERHKRQRVSASSLSTHTYNLQVWGGKKYGNGDEADVNKEETGNRLVRTQEMATKIKEKNRDTGKRAVREQT